MHPIRIGVVGAHPERSWAKDSHIPAIAQVPGVTLAAVAGRSEVGARSAAEAFGAPCWFADAAAMCSSDAVDLISVCVKVPEHAAIVRAALSAGKHVYCEWPLGRSPAESEALAREAVEAGVHHAVGLQARAAPAVRRARDLITGGRIGRPLSAQVVSTTAGYAARLPSAYAYLNDPASGANLSTILGGHTLDLVEQLLGEVREINALTTTKHPEITLVDAGETIPRRTPDQLFVLARFANGCTASIEVSGDRPPDTPFICEVIGSAGTLRLLGGHPHGFQAGQLTLEIDGLRETLPSAVASGGLRDAAANVGETYATLARDIHVGTRNAADFIEAARLSHLVASVGRAAASGALQTIDVN